MIDVISSATNPIAKRIRALAERKHRKREQVFLVEGMQPVWRAAESGWDIDTLILAPDLVRNSAVYEMENSLRSLGTTILYLTADLFTRLSDREGPSGVMAIVRMQTIPLHQAIVSKNDVWILLHRVHNPGNLGTIIRTADASGCAGLILTGDTTDPFTPAAVKASMGSIFSLPLVIEPDDQAVIAWAHECGIPLIATSGYAENAHWDFEWNRPLGILLGNEGDGLPQELALKAGTAVRIPMIGTAESLNLSVAAAILMYEAQRYRID